VIRRSIRKRFALFHAAFLAGCWLNGKPLLPAQRRLTAFTPRGADAFVSPKIIAKADVAMAAAAREQKLAAA
jgi:hypothetical protein